MTVPQFLCGDCPPACPCPTVSFSAVHWGELLCIWAGRREFGWAVEAEEVPALCLHTLSCPQELVCVPMPSGGKRTAAFPWKTARCHKVKLGGSGELSSSADCWEDRPQTVRKFKEYLFSPVWKSRAGCFPVEHLWVATSQAASVSSGFWCETVSFKKRWCLKESVLLHYVLKAAAFWLPHCRHASALRSNGVSGTDACGARCEDVPKEGQPSLLEGSQQVLPRWMLLACLGTSTAPFCSRTKDILVKYPVFLPRKRLLPELPLASFWHLGMVMCFF